VWAVTGGKLAAAAHAAQPQQQENAACEEAALAVGRGNATRSSSRYMLSSGRGSSHNGSGGGSGYGGPAAPLDERDAAQLAWATASLRLRPPAPWLRALWAAAAPGLPCYSTQAASTLLWAAARLGGRADGGNSGGSSSCPGARPSLAWVDAALSAASRDLASLQPQGAVQLLWALATLRHRPSAGFMRQALARLQLELHVLPPEGFASVLWSLVSLGYSPGDTWWSSCWYCLAHKAGAMGAFEVASVAAAAAALQADPPPGVIAALSARGLAVLPGAAPAVAARLLLALAQLGWQPRASSSDGSDGVSDGSGGNSRTEAAAVLSACGAALRSAAATASPSDALGLLRAAAALGLAPDRPWLEAAEAALLAGAKGRPVLSPSEAADGVVLVAALGGAPGQAWADAMLASAVPKPPPAADATPVSCQRQQQKRGARRPLAAEQLDALAAALAGWDHVLLEGEAVRRLLAARVAAAGGDGGVTPLKEALVAWEALAARCGAAQS
jgi:hypothetical protein